MTNFSPFTAITKNFYRMHISPVEDLLHIIEKNRSQKYEHSAEQVRKLRKTLSELRTMLLIQLMLCRDAHCYRVASGSSASNCNQQGNPVQLRQKESTAIKAPDCWRWVPSFISIFISDLPCGQANHTTLILAKSTALQESAKQHYSIIPSICT